MPTWNSSVFKDLNHLHKPWFYRNKCVFCLNMSCFLSPFPSISPVRHWMKEKMRRMTREAMPIPLNVAAAPAGSKSTVKSITSLIGHFHAVRVSHQSSWRTRRPPWRRSPGPGPDGGPAGSPEPTSWAPGGRRRSGRRCRRPRPRRGSLLETQRTGRTSQNKKHSSDQNGSKHHVKNSQTF